MDGKSKDLGQEYVAQLAQLFPEVVTEVAGQEGEGTSRKVDMEKLALLLGEVALPSDDIEYRNKYQEKFTFEWAGKRRAIAEAQKRSTGTLRPCVEDSVDWDTTENVYIEGDNLEVLKLLQNAYLGKIKMIYIDPPYNTGKDFVYKDNYKDNLENYLEQTNTTGAVNSEASGRFHTNWLNMMYPRLRLARNLLTDDGVIFISIGEAEVNNLVSICNELFGEDNKLGLISRQMKSGGGSQGRYFQHNIDYILVFAKDITKANYFKDKISEELSDKVYNQIETVGERKGERFRTMGLFQSSLGEYRPNQKYFITCPDGEQVLPPCSVQDEIMREGDGRWRWSKERFEKELIKDNIVFKRTATSPLLDKYGNKANWNIYTKIWLNDRIEDGTTPSDLITKFENRHSAKELQQLKIPFDFAKPSDLIKYIINISNKNKESIILDFFSGSATTAHAVMQLNAEDGGNRKYICVQLPEQTPEDCEAHKFLTELGRPTIIPEIAKERIRRAGKKITEEQMAIATKVEENNLFSNGQEPNVKLIDKGFKVFKLDRSNVKNWDVELDGVTESEAANILTYALHSSVEILKADRSESDLLYEVMLKLGVQLSDPIEEVTIDDKTIFVIGYGVMVATFAKDMSYAQIAKMLEYRANFIKEGEFKVVISDDSFASDNDKTNILQLFKQKRITNFEII